MIAVPRPRNVEPGIPVMMEDDPSTANPLTNYERTPLGDWRIPAPADRKNPWVRLLLLAPKRPVVIDVAVRIDDKSFREARNDWIDRVIADSKSASNDSEPPKHGLEITDTAISKTPSASTETAAKDIKKTKGDEKPKPEKSPGVAAVARSAPTMRERLHDYLATTGGGASRDEVSWLVAESDSGPPIVMLDPSLSWQRAGEEPLWALLDQNGDGVLSASEIEERELMFRRADTDSNDVVEISEIRRIAKRPVNLLPTTGHSLVVLLDANTDWDSLARSVAHIYQSSNVKSDSTAQKLTLCERMARGDTSLDGEQLRGLCNAAADLTLRAAFCTTDSSDKSGVAVLAGRPELVKSGGLIAAKPDVLSFDLDGDVLEVSAGQVSGGGSAQPSDGQLGIGAVIDGYPLLRMLDSDQDQRLTLREREALGGLLQSLDRNGDGQVTAVEVPIPIRLGFTLGPHVHELLRSPVGAARTLSPHESHGAPNWFISMDKNHDGDISRAEFLGTNEQFKQLDLDGDGLISVDEAQKALPTKSTR